MVAGREGHLLRKLQQCSPSPALPTAPPASHHRSGKRLLKSQQLAKLLPSAADGLQWQGRRDLGMAGSLLGTRCRMLQAGGMQ